MLFWPLWIVLLVLVILGIIVVINLRKVVPTNEVHIVQRKSESTAHWRWYEWWNVYLHWPSWVPSKWVSVTQLPLSVFNIKLADYKWYDIWKVPFLVDVTAFFTINDPITAAQKISTFEELEEQLTETLKWAVRKILAQNDILKIMESRWEMWQVFYDEVLTQVKQWWIDLKNIEFMDIRDLSDTHVIENIMKKKKATIEANARKEVAEQNKFAEIAEDNSRREAELNRIQNAQETRLREIEAEKMTENQNIDKERLLSLQQQEAQQNILESQRTTKEKELSVRQLEQERMAEIEKQTHIIWTQEDKEKKIISAEADKRVMELNAEAEKQQKIIAAEADKQSVEMKAQADKFRIESEWLAEAKRIDYMWTAQAKNKMEMAKALNSFSPEALAYMIKELEVQLSEKVDTEKAKALSTADIKVISTWANWWEWLNNFMELFSTKWWANIWWMIQSIKDTIWEDKFNQFVWKFNKPQDWDNV